MAGDWIKISNVTPDKPEVHHIAAELGIDPDAVVGKLIRLWIWADQQTVTGMLRCERNKNVTTALLDRVVRHAGFADAMCSAGWLVIKNKEVLFPNFDRHNGKTAKKRALSGSRVKRFRNADGVTETLQKRNKSVTREEKRRSNTPLPPKGGTGRGENNEDEDAEPIAFAAFAEAYPEKSGRDQALAEWRRLDPSPELANRIVQSVLDHVAHNPKWKREGGRFIPKPAKFLKDHQWKWKPPIKNGSATINEVLENMRRTRERDEAERRQCEQEPPA